MALDPAIVDKLKNIPEKPGVYFMRDKYGRIIYIGKAVNLRRRVQSYFRPSTLRKADPKVRSLIRSIADLEVMSLKTEEEASVTEGRLIKEYRPKYNSMMKDDKRFLLLRVHLQEPYPRFSFCRFARDDGAEYLGPFSSSAAAREALNFIERKYGLRRCKPREPGEEDYRHCHNDIIRFCSAPCIGRVSRETYQERVLQALAFLRGESQAALRELYDEMQQQAEAMRFEKAASLRDVYLMLTHKARKRVRAAKAPQILKEEALAGIHQLQSLLDLPAPPQVIECFDISNISGTHAVGSMVCSVAGVPTPARYRLFRIKTISGIDDPAMMAEVIQRRYSRLQREQKPLPGLVLVDGGLTQMRAARRELDALGLTQLRTAGLAKQYEEFYSDADRGEVPLFIPRESPALHVVKQIRDEAHRFALTYHRKLRLKRMRESVLDDVPGVGEKRKQQLLKHFGSLSRLKKASQEEVQAVSGITAEVAETIYMLLHS